MKVLCRYLDASMRLGMLKISVTSSASLITPQKKKFGVQRSRNVVAMLTPFLALLTAGEMHCSANWLLVMHNEVGEKT